MVDWALIIKKQSPLILFDPAHSVSRVTVGDFGFDNVERRDYVDLYSLWLILPLLLRSSAGRRKFFMSKLPSCLFALVSLSSVRSVLHHSYLLIDHDCLCGDVVAIAPSSFPASDSIEINMEKPLLLFPLQAASSNLDVI